MGYTHYFPQTRSFTNDEWSKIQSFAKSLFIARKDMLADGMGNINSKPKATAKDIWFNGIGEEAHETFLVRKTQPKKLEDRHGQFTKTNRKAYDECVVAMLTYINHVAPGALEITSDGSREPDMWVLGTELAENITHHPLAPLFPMAVSN
jgi:hypothetical protein